MGKRVAIWLDDTAPTSRRDAAGFAALVTRISLEGIHIDVEAGLDEPRRLVLPHGLIWDINGDTSRIPSDSEPLRNAQYKTTYCNDDLRRKIMSRAELTYQEDLGRAEDA